MTIIREHVDPWLRRRLLAGGLLVGVMLGVGFFVVFEPVNGLALRLQEGLVGRTSVTTLGIGLVLSFVSGATMVFTPCGMPLIFTLNKLAADGRERGRSWVGPFAAFTVGMVLVMAIWGAVIGGAGGAILDAVAGEGRAMTTAVAVFSLFGVLALLMALWELGFVDLPRPMGGRAFPDRLRHVRGYPRAFGIGAALGGGFGVGCPFPTYQAVLAYAALVGNPLLGAGLLAANGLGRAAPQWVIGGLVYRGEEQRRVSRWLVGNAHRARMINGTMLAALGAMLLVLWGGLIPSSL